MWPKKPACDPVSILTGKQKCNFYACIALRSLILIQPNLLLGCTWTRQIYIPNLKQIAPANHEIWASKISLKSSFSDSSCNALFIFGHKMQMHTVIELKLDKHEGPSKRISVPILVGIWWRFTELWSIFCVKNIKGLSCRQDKLLEGIGWNLACRWNNHRRSAYEWFEKNWEKDQGDTTQNKIM